MYPPPPPPTGLQVLGFSLFLFVAVSAAYLWSERADPVFNNAKARSAVLAEAVGYTTGTFGHSQAAALSMDVLGRDAFHFWEPGSDLFENLRMLEHARREMPSMREVFLTVSPIQGDNGAVPDRNLRRKAVYYETGTLRSISPGDWRNALTSHVTPLARPDNWKAIFSGPRLDPVEIEPNGWIERTYRVTPPDSLDATGARNAAYHVGLMEASVTERPEVCESVQQALADFVQVAGPETQVVLYTPPFYASYRAQIPWPAPCDAVGASAALALAHDNVVYFNYLDHPLASDRTLFRDSNHLNEAGTERFSKIVRRDLEAAGIRGPERMASM